MNPASIPMPGALRLRALHPLIDGDGSCSLIYDLERAAVLEVPAELQFHVAPALETGDWDEDLLSWLVNEDLVTAEGWAGWDGGEGATTADTGWWSLETVYRVDDEVHARIDQATEAEILDVLELAFKHTFSTSRVKLHLDWKGGFPGTGLLERVVVEASRLAGLTRQEVAYELTLDPPDVTPMVARFVTAYPFHVRLRCGSFPERADGASIPLWRDRSVDEAVRLLRAHGLTERLTLHCTLAAGARLLDLWSWAKRAGARHLDAVRVEPSPVDGVEALVWMRQFRDDLQVMADEMGNDLESQELPLDFLPMTRIVRRLMRSEPMSRFEDQPGPAPGLIAVADAYALPGVERLAPRLLTDLWMGGVEEWESEALLAEAGADKEDLPCRSCWARYVCSHSSLASSGLEGDDARVPSDVRCGIWKDEAEAALRLYHRMAHADPIQVLRLFEEATSVPGEPLAGDWGGSVGKPS